ncbi:hypothetical protein BB559_007177 [Furculomyces boomerangus]|uniref:Ubiquitin-conjugating enzyme E2C-binding protein n=2 Tax=Harpellales TaxID=61421 RepID=A0A2T9XYL8_9FUNG|nr:hypothetical protein BB559_007177 [Furculomyces boomerangus]PVZ99930.1 hypothetical protein BB558_004042 [Smittium angustum]
MSQETEYQQEWDAFKLPSIYIETLPNLNFIDTFIKLPKIPNLSELDSNRILVSHETDWLRIGFKKPIPNTRGINLELKSWSEKLILPCRIDTKKTHISILKTDTFNRSKDKDSIYLKIRLTPIDPVFNLNNKKHKKPQEITSILFDENSTTNKINAKNLSNLKSIKCKNCSNCLATLESDTKHLNGSWKVAELPSEYWEEMVDFWVCHPEGDKLAVNASNMDIFNSFTSLKVSNRNQHEKTTNEQAIYLNSKANNISDQKEDKSYSIRIGNTFVIIESDLLEPDTILHSHQKHKNIPSIKTNTTEPQSNINSSTDPENTIDRDISKINDSTFSDLIYCSNCLISLGKYIPENSLYSKSKEEKKKPVIQLWKHRLIFVLDNFSQLVVSLDNLIALDVLNKISAHASYHYIIYDQETNIPSIAFWVIGWNIHTFNSFSKNNKTQVSDICSLQSFGSGIKVLYFKYNSDSDSDKKLLDSWKTNFDPECIYLDKSDCNDVYNNLEMHYNMIPKPIQLINGMKVSFIFPNF